MRAPVDAERLRRFLHAAGQVAAPGTRLYLTGGASAVLVGWRASTIDIDLKAVPEDDTLLRQIPRLKDELGINVELASPSDFIPELPGWESRCASVGRDGNVAVFHYDFYAQALSKLERGHAKDVSDVEEMARRGLIDGPRLLELYGQIEPVLYRYPALDARSFRKAVEDFVGRTSRER